MGLRQTRLARIEADAAPRLARDGSGWTWPTQAPLAGRIRARLPDLGVWSLLAPPGASIGGTLEADATLSGDRSATALARPTLSKTSWRCAH